MKKLIIIALLFAGTIQAQAFNFRCEVLNECECEGWFFWDSWAFQSVGGHNEGYFHSNYIDVRVYMDNQTPTGYSINVRHEDLDHNYRSIHSEQVSGSNSDKLRLAIEWLKENYNPPYYWDPANDPANSN